MLFHKLFKPKWRHKNPEVRLQAVSRATDQDEAQLLDLVKADSDERVRLAALEKLHRVQPLQEAFALLGDDRVRVRLGEKIQRLLLEQILESREHEEAIAVLDGLDDQGLARVAGEAEGKKLRLAAVEKITGQDLLCDVLKANCGKEPGLAALAKLHDAGLLEEAAEKASNKAVRSQAMEKLETLQGQRPDQEEAARLRQVEKLLAKAAEVQQLPDPEAARNRFTELHKEWLKLNVGDKQPAALQFQEALTAVNSRCQTFTEHRRTLAEKQAAYKHQIHTLAGLCDQLVALLASPAESDDQKVNQASGEFSTIVAELLGPRPEELVLFFDEISRDWQESRRVIAAEQEVLARFQEGLDAITANWKEGEPDMVMARASALRTEVGATPLKYLSQDEILDSITNLLDLAAQEKEERTAALKEVKESNLAARRELIGEIEGLVAADNVGEAGQRVDEIRGLWKHPDPLPDDHGLEAPFQQALARFYEHKYQAEKKKDWQLWANRNLKEELLASMEALDQREDLHQVFQRIRELQNQWKQVGAVPAKEGNRLWQRFKSAGDRNFQRCQEFFRQLDQEAARNLEQKMELIKEAETHRQSEEWKKSADSLKELQSRWKTIGRAPKDQEERIFQEFRQVCNSFFERRKAHYEELDRQRQESLAKKEALCVQIEELVESPGKEDGARIRKMQEEWKKCGSGPREKEQEVWLRFRAACDRYYAWLDTLRPENLARKEELCAKAEQAFGSLAEDRANLQVINKELLALQKEWKTIGPAPAEKQEEIWQRFRVPCDQFFRLQKEHYAELDRQRPENEAKKREILEKASGLLGKEGRQAVNEIIELQEAWKKIGPAGRNQERDLNQRMKEVCNGFFRDRRRNFEEMDQLRRENHKKKEELCLRLELLAGVQPKTTAQPDAKSNLTLAEQLKLAFESNFATAGGDARRKKDEVEQIRKEWKAIGEVPREHEHSVKKRYQKALDACFGEKKKRKNHG